MDGDLSQKIGIAVFSALFGWLIAQITAIYRVWRERRKIVNLLHEELSDIQREVERVAYYHASNLSFFDKKGRVNKYGAIEISNPIYTGYYKDALLALNQDQRISFQAIHKLIEDQNNIVNRLHEQHELLQYNCKEEQSNPSILKVINNLSNEGLSSCLIISWHIEFHLKNRENPKLNIVDNKKNYLQFEKEISKKKEIIVSLGINTLEQRFEEIYRESYLGTNSSGNVRA